MTEPRWYYILIIAALLLGGCSGARPATASTSSNPTQKPADNTAAAESQTTPSPKATETLTALPQRGPGEFDLAAMDAGLDNLARFQAVLSLVFDGTRDGQPYHIEKTYTQVVDRSQKANLLQETGLLADGTATQIFSGTLGAVRYSQPAADQPCLAGRAVQESLFTPASLLPHFIGAEPSDTETVAGISANVYTFDQRALGSDEVSTGTGKVWIAADDGRVLKYELSLQSDVIFGENISGTQTWEYTLQDPGENAVLLPGACPLPLTGVPIPDGATGVTNLAAEIDFQTQLSMDALASFYSEQLTGLGYYQQGEAIDTSSATRWVYGKQDDQQQATILAIKAADTGSGLSVQIVKINAEIPAQ